MRRLMPLVLVLAACSSATKQETTQTITTSNTVQPTTTIDLTHEVTSKHASFAARREQVWNAVLDTHQALQIPFARGDVRQGDIVFEVGNRLRTIGGKPASRYFDCGQGSAGPRVDTYRLTVRVIHTLENPKPDSTVLGTAVLAWAKHAAISGDPVPCNSLGSLENEIAGMVAARLK